MNELQKTLAPLGKPYTITRSRLGAITKVIEDRYICDLSSLRELSSSIIEKLNTISAQTKSPEFSFLISFNDQTHHDGVAEELISHSTTIPIGKQTDRVVLRWNIFHMIDEVENELTLTIRISNPVNPLVFLQAALSKSANEIDNIEFEMGSTCITVDGATHSYAEEIFLRAQNWIKARNKPHPYISISEFYSKYESYLDYINSVLLPILLVAILSIVVSDTYPNDIALKLNPVIFCFYFALQPIALRVNRKMALWAKKSKYISLFLISNGDVDAVTRLASTAKNSFIKLAFTTTVSFLLNVAAGIVCWQLTS